MRISPSVQQCPIAPGSSFTYTFQADLYGTSWYHSHYSAQYAGGLFGPMIIHGPKNADYDVDLGPVLLASTLALFFSSTNTSLRATGTIETTSRSSKRSCFLAPVLHHSRTTTSSMAKWLSIVAWLRSVSHVRPMLGSPSSSFRKESPTA